MKNRFLFIVSVAVMLLVLPYISSARNISFQGNAKVTYSTIAWEGFNGAGLSAGIRSDRNYLGVGSGYNYYRHTEQMGSPIHTDRFYAPLYLDYIHYHPFRKATRSSYFIGAEAGGAFGMKAPDCNSSFSYHAVFKTGFDFGITDDIGLFISLDLVTGYVYGIGALTVGFRI